MSFQAQGGPSLASWIDSFLLLLLLFVYFQFNRLCIISFFFQEERLLFMQFPDVLPIKPLSHEDNMPNDNEDSPKSSSISVSLNITADGILRSTIVGSGYDPKCLRDITSLY